MGPCNRLIVMVQAASIVKHLCALGNLARAAHYACIERGRPRGPERGLARAVSAEAGGSQEDGFQSEDKDGRTAFDLPAEESLS